MALKLVSLFIGLLFLSSCQLKDDEDFGPEADPNEVLGAMYKSFGERTMEASHPGDWVLYQKTQQAFSQEPLTTEYIAYQILSKSPTTERIDFEIAKTIYDSDEEIVDQSIDACSFYKDALCTTCEASPVDQCVSQFQTLSGEQAYSSNYTPNNSQPYFTLHKFQYFRYQVNPPERVMNSENCLGIPGCKLNISQIKYNLVEWPTKGPPNMTHIDMQITPDAPFIGSLFSQCVHFVAIIDDRQVPIALCRKVIDFLFEGEIKEE